MHYEKDKENLVTRTSRLHHEHASRILVIMFRKLDAKYIGWNCVAYNLVNLVTMRVLHHLQKKMVFLTKYLVVMWSSKFAALSIAAQLLKK